MSVTPLGFAVTLKFTPFRARTTVSLGARPVALPETVNAFVVHVTVTFVTDADPIVPDPFVTTQEFWNLYDHDKIDLPVVPHIPLTDRDPWSQRYAYTIREDEHDVSEAHLRNARHAYYGMVSYFDSLIGRLLEHKISRYTAKIIRSGCRGGCSYVECSIS